MGTITRSFANLMTATGPNAIADGTIVNADINASAGIEASKLTGLSSDFVLLATTDASSSASVSFDGYFSSTYKNYVIYYSYMIPSSSSLPRLRFRRSNADVTASHYWSAGPGYYRSSSSSDHNSIAQSNADSINIVNQNMSTTTSDGGISGFITILDPLQTSSYKVAITQNGSRDTNNWYGTQVAIQLRDSTSALSGISFFYSSGNIASGNFKLYGIK